MPTATQAWYDEHPETFHAWKVTNMDTGEVSEVVVTPGPWITLASQMTAEYIGPVV